MTGCVVDMCHIWGILMSFWGVISSPSLGQKECPRRTECLNAGIRPATVFPRRRVQHHSSARDHRVQEWTKRISDFAGALLVEFSPAEAALHLDLVAPGEGNHGKQRHALKAHFG